MNFTEDTVVLPTNHPARSKDLPWYNPSLSGLLRPSMSLLLENWSKVPGDEIEAHIYSVVSGLQRKRSLYPPKCSSSR